MQQSPSLHSTVAAALPLTHTDYIAMDKEAEHLLAGDDSLQDECDHVHRMPYGRRSKLSSTTLRAFFSSYIFLVFLLSLVVLFLRTFLGYEAVTRPLTLAKDIDLMMYCKSGTAENLCFLL